MDRRRHWLSVSLVLLALLIFLTMPRWAQRNAIHLAVEFFYLAALAGMWNLLAGYGGLVSIGQQAYVGIGGYSVVAFALLLGVNPFVSVFLGGVIAVAVSIPTAFVVFRLRGPHFAVGTWAVAEVYRLVAAINQSITMPTLTRRI